MCLTFLSSAQDNGFFDQIWLDEGLSQSSITNITQDQKGYVWFGTQDGLNRYDGKQIDRFNFQPFNPNSISGDNILDIAADSSGNIWVLNTAGWLDLLNPNTLKATHISEILNIKGEGRRFISKIWQLNNRLFLFTTKGFCELITKGGRYELNYFTFQRNKDAPRIFVFAACFDDAGNIYVGTNEGLYFSAAGSQNFLFSGFKTSTGHFTKECRALFFKNHTLYFSQENIFYSCKSGQIHSISSGPLSVGVISSALGDNHGNIWLGTTSNGLYMVSELEDGSLKEEKHFIDNSIRYGLKCNFINCLFQSRHPNEDIVWIGSRDAGVFSYSYSKNSFQLVSSVLKGEKPNVWSITKDKDNIIWAGTYTGIYRIDRAAKNFSFLNLENIMRNLGRPIDAMYCDSANTIWVGIGNSLYTIDRKKNSLQTIVDQVLPEKRTVILHIIELSHDSLLLGTNVGVVVYNKTSKVSRYLNTVSVNDSVIKITGASTMFTDSKKNWWIGTNFGLIFIDKATHHNKLFCYDPANKSSLLASVIMDINEDKSGNILVATTKGLSIIKDPQKGQFENFYIQQGLTNNYIYALLPDKSGRFWMSTNYGISVFDPAQKKFRSYRGSDGVFINEFNQSGFHAAYDGELLFGGLDGLVGLYPEKLVRNILPPTVLLRAFRINQAASDSLLLKNTALNLKHNQNGLYFEFAVPDFSGKNRTHILYKLNGGVSNTWTDLNESYILNLANLAPGRYVLDVKAINADGIESQKNFSFAFVIHPPFWNTWWFYVLVVLFLVGMVWLIYRNRLRNKIAHLKEIQNIRQEENEKVRKAAALDLHDEFGNGLTRISMLVEMAKIKIPKENEDALKLLNIISENSSRLYQGTKDFIWSINPGNDNLFEIIIRIKDYGDELFYGTGVNFEILGLNEELKKLKQPPGTGRNIAMIYKEALSNIMKHAKAGNVKLTVEQSAREIILNLKDNGKGFDQKQNKNSFGISNMHQRASRIGAEVKIHSELNAGSEIELTIPKTEAA
ncbi:MAG: ligand-binding sensor domain-containing protein [Bacteroidia bacterium]